MADGHLNKCKECAKSDTRLNTLEKSKDESWVEKERIRSRERYHRLNYKDKPWSKKTRNELYTIDNVSRSLRIRGFDTRKKEAHHWNYNLPKSVVLLSPKAHHRIHKFVRVNREDKFLYTLEGERLDTEEKTIAYYQKILSQYDDISENLEIINY